MDKRISKAIRTSKWRLRIYATRQPSLNGSSIRLKYQCPNIHKRIFIDFDFKTSKIGIYTKSIQTKINCTRISVRNSYLTIEDNYRLRCEIKISPLNPKTMNEKLEDKGRSTTFKSNSRSLILSFKRRTFPKLGLGISEIDKRMSWRRRREAYQWVLLLVWS